MQIADLNHKRGLGDVEAIILGGFIPKWKCLGVLNLEYNRHITHIGWEAIATSMATSSLTELNFYRNTIDNTGAIALAGALPTMVSLQVVDLSYNKHITEVGWVAIGKAVASSKIRVLDLSFNLIRDEAAR